VSSEEVRLVLEQTKNLVTQMNANIAAFDGKITALKDALMVQTKLSAAANDIAYVLIRAMANVSEEHRANLMTVLQEPVENKDLADMRAALLRGVSEQRRFERDKPNLKPVE
jgi:hypothetical protein